MSAASSGLQRPLTTAFLVVMLLCCYAFDSSEAISCWIGIDAVATKDQSPAFLSGLKGVYPTSDFTPKLLPGYRACYNFTMLFGPSGAQVHVFGGIKSGNASDCGRMIRTAYNKEYKRAFDIDTKVNLMARNVRSTTPTGFAANGFGCCNTNACNQATKAARQSKYDSAQLLGFSINTFPAFIDDKRVYLGVNDTGLDMAVRVLLLEAAMDSAYESTAWNRSSSVLKVFMAPEFYLRGPTGAYDASELIDGMYPLGDGLYNLTRDAKWADWLFVFGTIVAAEPPDNVNDTDGGKGTYMFYNVAPIFKGNSTLKLLAFKSYVSDIDFLDQRADPDYVPDPRSLGQDQYSTLPDAAAEALELDGYAYVKNNVFEVDGLRIGIEICLDHAMNSLYNNLRDASFVDLHLITSAGMSIAGGQVGTAQGGPVFLVDGAGRTEMSRNDFGQGHVQPVAAAKGVYNSGPTQWTTAGKQFLNYVDAVLACMGFLKLELHECVDEIEKVIRAGGTRAVLRYGASLLAGPYDVASTVDMTQVEAIPYDPRLGLFYNSVAYDALDKLYKVLGMNATTVTAPSVDIYDNVPFAFVNKIKP